MSLRHGVTPHKPRDFTDHKGKDWDGGDEITLADVQIAGLASIARHDRATALRVNTKAGEGAKATDLYVTTYSHDLGWNALGYHMRPSGAWCMVGSMHWKSPTYERAEVDERVPPPGGTSAYKSTKDGS